MIRKGTDYQFPFSLLILYFLPTLSTYGHHWRSSKILLYRKLRTCEAAGVVLSSLRNY